MLDASFFTHTRHHGLCVKSLEAFIKAHATHACWTLIGCVVFMDLSSLSFHRRRPGFGLLADISSLGEACWTTLFSPPSHLIGRLWSPPIKHGTWRVLLYFTEDNVCVYFIPWLCGIRCGLLSLNERVIFRKWHDINQGDMLEPLVHMEAFYWNL